MGAAWRVPARRRPVSRSGWVRCPAAVGGARPGRPDSVAPAAGGAREAPGTAGVLARQPGCVAAAAGRRGVHGRRLARRRRGNGCYGGGRASRRGCCFRADCRGDRLAGSRLRGRDMLAGLPGWAGAAAGPPSTRSAECGQARRRHDARQARDDAGRSPGAAPLPRNRAVRFTAAPGRRGSRRHHVAYPAYSCLADGVSPSAWRDSRRGRRGNGSRPATRCGDLDDSLHRLVRDCLPTAEPQPGRSQDVAPSGRAHQHVIAAAYARLARIITGRIETAAWRGPTSRMGNLNSPAEADYPNSGALSRRSGAGRLLRTGPDQVTPCSRPVSPSMHPVGSIGTHGCSATEGSG